MAEYIIQDVTLTAIADEIRAKTGKTDDLTLHEMISEISNIEVGEGLNFTVVGGTTQPNNPTENTIWVNTSTDITGWYFSVTQPENMINGDVWFETNMATPIEFNALKDNNIQLYPTDARQYVNSALVDVPVMIYQNNEWVNWWDGELYKSGNEYPLITGGWVGKAMRGNSSGNDLMPTITKGGNDITASISGNSHGGIIHTAKKIDLTKYNKIIFKGKLSTGSNYYANASLCVWSDFNYYWYDYDARMGVTGTTSSGASKTNGELDISNLTGEYYIGFGLYVSASVTFSEVILE